MIVKVRSLTGQTDEISGLREEDSVRDLKARINSRLQIPVPIQRIIYRGAELADDSASLVSCAITDGAVVHLIVRTSEPKPQSVEMQNGVGVVRPSQSQARMFQGEPPAFHSEMAIQMDLENTWGASENVFSALRQARIVRFVAVIDIIFLMFAAIGFLPLFALLPLPILGYLGTKNLRPWLIFSYIFYLALSLAYRGYFFYFSYVDTKNTNLLILSFIWVALQLFIMFMVIRFFRLLRSLTEIQRLQLVELQNILSYQNY